MVKADVTRDYYADLGLQHGADVNDIKKAYRKLALQFHPDRNPGKETEVSPRFQEINWAHEILTDPQQRAKYDADRIKAGYYSAYSMPTRSAFAASRAPYTNYPPPPTRQHPTSANRHQKFAPQPTNAQPSNGASRYAQFARAQGVPPTNSGDDGQSKAHQYNAFQHMKQAQAGRGFNTPPRQGRDPTSQPAQEGSNSMPRGSPPKPRPAWEQFQNPRPGFPGFSRTQSTKLPKKAGFAPATPGGDEPAAPRSSAYFNLAGNDRQFPHEAPPQSEPVPPPPTAEQLDPLRRFKTHPQADDPFGDGKPRISTPYATTGGEKTYFSSATLGRSASTREPPNRADWNGTRTRHDHGLSPPGSGERHRSSSPLRRRPFSGASSSSGGSAQPGFGGRREDFGPPRTRGPEEERRKTHGTPMGPRTKVSGGSETSSSSETDARSESLTEAFKEKLRRRRRQARKSETHLRPDNLPREYFQVPGTVREQHRQAQQQHATGEGNRSRPTTSGMSEDPRDPRPPLEKFQSWHKKFEKGPEGLNPNQDHQRHTSSNGKHHHDHISSHDGANGGKNAGSNKKADTMYDPKSYTFSSSSKPHSDRTSRFAVFGRPTSPKDMLKRSPALPPYWAFPSPILPRGPAFEQRSSSMQGKIFDDTFQPFIKPDERAKANMNSMPSFTIPIDKETFNGSRPAPPTFRSHSSENIDTQFSPTEFTGSFMGNGVGHEHLRAHPTNGKTDSRPHSRSSPIRGRPVSRPDLSVDPQSSKPPKENVMDGAPSMPPPPPPPGRPMPSQSPRPAKFSPAEWAQTFKDPTWAGPSPSPLPSPGRTGSFSTKRPQISKTRAQSRGTTRRKAAPKPINVNAATNGPPPTGSRSDSGTTAESFSSRTSGDSNAMDIDPVTPEGTVRQSHGAGISGAESMSGPRLVHVEPARAEWAHDTISADDKTPRAAPPPMPPRPGPPPQSATEASHLNLRTFKNVEPFAPTAQGLRNLKDLSSTLPFPSQSSVNSPLTPVTPQNLSLPNPPKAPMAPTNPTQNSWERYIATMRAYLFEWNQYNRTMLQHFSSRQASVDELSEDWLNCVGEGSKGGYKKYMQGLEEDFRVRSHWEVSWEKHRDAMRDFGKCKGKKLRAEGLIA
ncbi:MAG: hypothetical protein M1812_007328 [Candelaria pacifica]|nr:MAG: hypothetical protein M1812_007328 [Candelaria pacifica]